MPEAFHSGREAKGFLISQIVAEAQSENVLLSEVERKMLYFTESGWTLPDMMKVSENFDREYDQDLEALRLTVCRFVRGTNPLGKDHFEVVARTADGRIRPLAYASRLCSRRNNVFSSHRSLASDNRPLRHCSSIRY
jgi:hypothetical protein